jgi:hypothetical protein
VTEGWLGGRVEEYLLYVGFYGSLGDKQPGGDPFVGESLGDEAKHLSFARRQLGERVAATVTSQEGVTIVGSTTLSPSEIRRSAPTRLPTSKTRPLSR